jgi:hypothetical protein
VSDVAAFYAVIAISAVVVLYLFWQQHRDQDRWQRKNDHQDLVMQIQREMHHYHTAVLSRCAALERELNAQRRMLRYVARRLS